MRWKDLESMWFEDKHACYDFSGLKMLYIYVYIYTQIIKGNVEETAELLVQIVSQQP